MTNKKTLNIGIIGNRDLTNKNTIKIQNTLKLLIDQIISTFSTNKNTQENDTHHTINIINSLAEGADQLAACTIIEMNTPTRLTCPIPFNLSQYRSTLTTKESQLTFDELLKNPKLSTETIELKLPFETDDLKNKGYRLAANKLLELSDFIIALYDPSKTGHTGGTKETIDFAIQKDIPIIHLNTSSPNLIAISSSYTNHKINFLNISELRISELQKIIPFL